MKINLENLLEWRKKKEVEYAGQYGQGVVNKKLCVTLSGVYKVYVKPTNNWELHYQTHTAGVAVNEYNNL